MSSHSSSVFRYFLALAFALSIVFTGGGLLRADPDIGTRVGIEVGPISVFYDALAPHGEWISTNEYGWVWIPLVAVVGDEFVPYSSNGRWVYTDAGWFFESDFDWGWAPFHYGRWYFDTALGWVWVPGRVWAPAWVDWRVGAGFVGWAPRPPQRLHGGVYPGHWVFVGENDFRRPHIHNYIVTRDRARRVYDRTRMVRQSRRVGDATIFRGPIVVTPGARGADTRPIRIAPPRRGVVGRVRIQERSASVQEMRPTPRVQRPVERPAPRREQIIRRPAPRAQQPSQAIRGPVRATVPRRSQQTEQRQQQRGALRQLMRDPPSRRPR